MKNVKKLFTVSIMVEVPVMAERYEDVELLVKCHSDALLAEAQHKLWLDNKLCSSGMDVISITD